MAERTWGGDYEEDDLTFSDDTQLVHCKNRFRHTNKIDNVYFL